MLSMTIHRLIRLEILVEIDADALVNSSANNEELGDVPCCQGSLWVFRSLHFCYAVAIGKQRVWKKCQPRMAVL